MPLSAPPLRGKGAAEAAHGSLEAAYARLRSLPLPEQAGIAGKYYKGGMPWWPEGEGA